MRMRRNPEEWWDDECDRLARNRLRASRVYKRNKCTANQIELKRCVALIRRAVRAKKREHSRLLQQD